MVQKRLAWALFVLCFQPSYIANQPSWFWACFFIHKFIFQITPPPSITIQGVSSFRTLVQHMVLSLTARRPLPITLLLLAMAIISSEFCKIYWCELSTFQVLTSSISWRFPWCYPDYYYILMGVIHFHLLPTPRFGESDRQYAITGLFEDELDLEAAAPLNPGDLVGMVEFLVTLKYKH